MRLVALDSGTSSTRAWLVEDGRVVGGASSHVGARDVAQGQSRRWLAEQLQHLIQEVVVRHGSDMGSLEAIVGFGMITSELGLEEVEHLSVPAGVEELATALYTEAGRALSDAGGGAVAAPVYLVPGVRCGDGGCRGDRDFMRGEETEVMGLLSQGSSQLPLLYVSPGSHTKLITVDPDGRIVASFTTLTGELVWALHKETILADLLDPRRDDVDLDHALEGAATARRDGLSRALFVARLRNRLDGLAETLCSDLVLGALAGADLEALERRGELPGTVAVYGTSGLARIYEALLSDQDWVSEVTRIESPLGPLGAWDIYQHAVKASSVSADRALD